MSTPTWPSSIAGERVCPLWCVVAVQSRCGLCGSCELANPLDRMERCSADRCFLTHTSHTRPHITATAPPPHRHRYRTTSVPQPPTHGQAGDSNAVRQVIGRVRTSHEWPSRTLAYIPVRFRTFTYSTSQHCRRPRTSPPNRSVATLTRDRGLQTASPGTESDLGGERTRATEESPRRARGRCRRKAEPFEMTRERSSLEPRTIFSLTSVRSNRACADDQVNASGVAGRRPATNKVASSPPPAPRPFSPPGGGCPAGRPTSQIGVSEHCHTSAPHN